MEFSAILEAIEDIKNSKPELLAEEPKVLPILE